MAGIDVSKINLYAVLGPPTGIAAAKTNSYAVLGPPTGVCSAKTNLYAVLEGSPVAPSWPAFTFGIGFVSTAYSQTFSAIGTPTITYSVVVGTLPTGLSLSGNSVVGTPTVAGTYAFTLRATNGFGTADISCSIIIYSLGLNPTVSGWSY